MNRTFTSSSRGHPTLSWRGSTPSSSSRGRRPWRSMTSCPHRLPRRYAPRNDGRLSSRDRCNASLRGRRPWRPWQRPRTTVARWNSTCARRKNWARPGCLPRCRPGSRDHPSSNSADSVCGAGRIGHRHSGTGGIARFLFRGRDCKWTMSRNLVTASAARQSMHSKVMDCVTTFAMTEGRVAMTGRKVTTTEAAQPLCAVDSGAARNDGRLSSRGLLTVHCEAFSQFIARPSHSSSRGHPTSSSRGRRPWRSMLEYQKTWTAASLRSSQ